MHKQIWIGYLVSFNPHTHEGCDDASSKLDNMQKVSIHTPTKGVTDVKVCVIALERVSIHTPTKGVTGCPYWFR